MALLANGIRFDAVELFDMVPVLIETMIEILPLLTITSPTKAMRLLSRYRDDHAIALLQTVGFRALIRHHQSEFAIDHLIRTDAVAVIDAIEQEPFIIEVVRGNLDSKFVDERLVNAVRQLALAIRERSLDPDLRTGP
jgi:hypothetical protein